MDSGKRFEQDFKKSITAPEISVDRIKDSMGGYKGDNTICDYILYKYPHQYYLELKSYKGRYVPMSAIRDHQYQGLLQKSRILGVFSGVLLNYRISDDTQETYYLDIRTVEDLKKQNIKGLPIEVAQKLGVLVTAHRKRTRYSYEVKEFLDHLQSIQTFLHSESCTCEGCSDGNGGIY